MTLNDFNIDQIDYELCRRDYGYYVEYVHEGRYAHGKFTRYLTKQVQEFIEKDTGHAYDILLLSVPSQHSKSMSVTETLPSWYLGKNPKHRVIEASYNDDFAKKFTRANADKVEKFGQRIFNIEIGIPNASNEFKLKNGIGSFISRGLQSGITGEPCELMIIDDPVKNAEEANSLVIREKVFMEWLMSCKPRLANGAKIIVIMTRWHEDDLFGRLFATERNVTRLVFPIICETETDELGRSMGDTLFPEPPMDKDKRWWEDFRQSFLTTQGTRAMNAIYFCRPSSAEGNLFQRKWFTDNLYDGTMKAGPDCYLIEKVKRIMGFVDTVQVLNDILSRYPSYNALLVEDKANGSAIVDVMKRKYHGVIPVQVSGGKESRANAVAPMIEAGNVHLKSNHTGDAEMIEECVSFPNGKHDDEVDAMTQALQWLKTHSGLIISVDATFKDANTSDYVSIQVWKRIPTQSNVSRDRYDNQVNDILGFGT